MEAVHSRLEKLARHFVVVDDGVERSDSSCVYANQVGQGSLCASEGAQRERVCVFVSEREGGSNEGRRGMRGHTMRGVRWKSEASFAHIHRHRRAHRARERG